MSKFAIPHEKKWLRPDVAYFDYQSKAQDINNPSEIEWNGKHKRIRELRDLAVFGLCLYGIHETPFFVQMNSKEFSPDAFIMRVSPNDLIKHEIGPVELTFYGRSRIGLPKQSLADKLSEENGKFWKLPEHYCLVVHIGKNLQVDHKEVADRLKSININFQVYSIREVSNYPDTIVQIVSYRPEYRAANINIGKVCHGLQKTNIPGNITQVRGKQPKTI